MAVKPIPDGYHTVTPYLIVEGADRVVEFMKRAFDAKQAHISTASGGKIMHADLQIGDSHVMIGEASERWKAMPAAIHLYVPDTDATYKKALQAGATSEMEPANQFYGDRMAGVKDPAGNSWWIATHVEDMAPEEMKRREQEWMKQRA